MVLKLHKSAISNPPVSKGHDRAGQQSTIRITGSKSESNRWLLLQALYPGIEIDNLSDSDDTKVMQEALQTNETIIDVHHAGTAMRFLTAFFATQEGRETIITGSERMKQRPIKVLVEALIALGADINYLENDGFPPLKIKGKALHENQVALKANVSSQYISALLLIAPKLRNGLGLKLEGNITSTPYIKMTLALLNEIGVKSTFNKNIIQVNHQSTINPHQSTIESDWSSASYFYSIVALSDVGANITLSSYKESSLQGDSILKEIYKDFGVATVFDGKSIVLTKISSNQKPTAPNLKPQTYNLNNAPDIAQTIAVTCFGLGIGCHLTGLHTLKIKETDRLKALKTELEKMGAAVSISEGSLILMPSKSIKKNIMINTYNDHRMAMAFAPLALKTALKIEDAMVVSKSYPAFWEDLKSIGFEITER